MPVSGTQHRHPAPRHHALPGRPHDDLQNSLIRPRTRHHGVHPPGGQHGAGSHSRIVTRGLYHTDRQPGDAAQDAMAGAGWLSVACWADHVPP